MRFDALLRAHGFMKVERPPEIWAGDTEDVRFLPLLGEMIASGLVNATPLAELTLSVANVIVEEPEPDDGGEDMPAAGEYLAVTVRGAGDWGPEGSWPVAGLQRAPWLHSMDERLRTAGVPFAYVRRSPIESSVTVFLHRVVAE